MKVQKCLFFLIFLSLFPCLLSANIFNRPRKVSVLSTKYFDFIYPKEAEKTASYLSLNADSTFEEAASYFSLEKLFRTPVAITFDSDSFSIEYTPSPYHRITVYQAPCSSSASYDGEPLYEEFRRTLFQVAAASKRTKFWEGVSCVVGGDALQPAALLNLPSAFFEGIVTNAANPDGNIIKDGFSLSLLSEAKAAGFFPQWHDLQGSRDIYSSSLSGAAMNAFCAYLISRFGIEKFKALHEKSGSVNFFSLTKGNFKKIYNIPLNQVWDDFYNAVPVTAGSAILELKAPSAIPSELIFTEDTESTFSSIYNLNGNLYFYDEAHSEVGLLNGNAALHNAIGGTKRGRLFLATTIKSITPSDDKKYLAISFSAPRHNRTLKKNTVRLYDLEKKVFTTQKYPLSNGAVFDYSIEQKTVAGFSSENGRTYIRAYPLKVEISSDVVYEKLLPFGVQPKALIPCALGKLICVTSFSGKTYLSFIDCFYQTEKTFLLPVNAKSFKKETNSRISFTWVNYTGFESGRRGFITLTENGEPTELFLQENTILGGVYDSFVAEEDSDSKSAGTTTSRTVYYSSHLASFHQLKKSPEESFKYKKMPLEEVTNRVASGTSRTPQSTTTGKSKTAPADEGSSLSKIATIPDWENSSDIPENGSLNGYRISKYHIAKYSLRGSTIPLFPILDIDFSKQTLAPGLGASYLTNTDPLENISGLVSFCAGYIDMTQKTFATDDNFALCGIVNTSVLPIDVSLSGIFKFDSEGSYDLRGLLGAKWNITAGLPHNKFTFEFQQKWESSTTYYDWENETVIEKKDWPSLNESYYTSSTNFGVRFSNVCQKGISTYEKFGFEGAISLIDINDPQKTNKNMTSERDESNQLTGSLELGVFFPYTIPAFGLENFVICMPLELKSQWYKENGTSSESWAEVLLMGYEIQRALPGLNLYFQRAGIKLGYDLKFTYDILSTEDPDIRNLGGFIDALKESVLDDYIYINLEAMLSPLVGKFAKSPKINAGLQFQMHMRSSKGEIKAILNLAM